jgi:hypothetical protein
MAFGWDHHLPAIRLFEEFNMPVTHRVMSNAAKRVALVGYLDISSTTPLLEAAWDGDVAIKIERIDLVYAIATDGGTRPESIQVGIPGTLTKYADVTPAASTAVNTVTSVTPSSTDLVAAGIPLVMTRSADTGGSNTGEVALFVYYSKVDP